jgi:hypothetical protein
VGGKGPGLFVPKTAGTIIPNDVLTRKGEGSNDQLQQQFGSLIGHMNISVPAGTSRATADQIATMTGAAVQRALRRNG